jgi:hypothetical protein
VGEIVDGNADKRVLSKQAKTRQRVTEGWKRTPSADGADAVLEQPFASDERLDEVGRGIRGLCPKVD